MENIFVWLKRGKSPKESAAEGTAEVINAVSASALTNVVVFVPIATMSSVVGMLVGPFAGVMVIATLASLFVSFTLTPILASLLLKSETGDGNTFWNRFFRFWDVGYDRLAAGFNRTMIWTRRYPKSVLLISLVLCVALLFLSLPNLRIAFMPFYDQNELSLVLEFPSNYGIDATREQTLELVEELSKRSDVVRVGTTVGYRNSILGQVSEGVNIAEATIILKPMGTRAPIKRIMDEIRQELEKKSGFLYALSMPTPTSGAGQELTGFIGGPELDVLEKYAEEGAEILRRSGMATDVDTSCRASKPRVRILPERALLKNMGVPVNAMGLSIVGYFDGVEAGTFKVGVDTFDIRVKMQEKEGLEQLQEIPAVPMNGKPVAMNALASLQSSPVAISLMRQDKERSAWIYANSAPGHSMDDLMRVLRKELAPK
jgi:HAE1 family hydrophobic/amphiphilic exporter-1